MHLAKTRRWQLALSRAMPALQANCCASGGLETAAPWAAGLRSAGAEISSWRGCARANVREVLSHSHFSEEYRPLKNVIARRAAAIAPFPLDIVRDVVGADLLAVAIDAAVCCVNVLAALEHSRLRAADKCPFLLRRIQD